MNKSYIKKYEEEKLKIDKVANFGRTYQQCAISVMDTIADPDITFDENGICNYYYEYLKQENEKVINGVEGELKLISIVNKIKNEGKGNLYDCITGVSGGVDSTYLALQAKKLGLRPLIVHFDNGWNSEIAVKNIENIISKLGFDLYTLVVDWEEFKDIQLSYLKASVVDIEAITDHAIIATLYKLAVEKNIKYILSGSNVVTEAVLPPSWIFNKTDHINLKDIHKKFGSINFKTFPLYTTKLKKISQFKKIQIISPLNYLNYNKEEIKNIIYKELGWLDYGGKHFESVFTRFFQGYILPIKFGIDKRKAHLSNLIFSKQITKEKALKILNNPIYNEQMLKVDFDFFLKKMRLNNEEFDKILLNERREHKSFYYEKPLHIRYSILKPFRVLIDTLHGK